MPSPIDFLREVFAERRREEAFVHRGTSYSYDWLLTRIETDAARLAALGVEPGAVVMLHGDFSPHALATFLALTERGNVIAPLSPGAEPSADAFAGIAGVSWHVRSSAEGLRTEPRAAGPHHPLLAELVERGRPGLVLFTSGASGEAKAVVHDLVRLLRKYRTRRQCLRTLAFLLFDHIGGIDTALYSLSNGSCLVLVEERSPAAVCEAIQRHRVAVLPAAPTFLNFLAISGAWRDYDLSSLEIVTYGAEVMPESTLRRCREMFPGVTLMQKYGASEVGTLRSKSRASDSLWVKLGGEGYQTRVVDGRLEIKAESSMLGYLNAPSPFTANGWFKTGDLVEVDGDYLRFLGRDSDVINVGGQKVYPAEVESVIAEMDNIADVVVVGEPNPLMGQVVTALVRTVEPETDAVLRRRVRARCLECLDKYKVPMKVERTEESLSSERFKRLRRAARESGPLRAP